MNNETITLKNLEKISNEMKFVCVDMVAKANSGHPGVCMGLSDIVTSVAKHINHNPKNPKWLNRDRIVFSGGHASALIYTFLHLSGYDLSLEDLKNFRQLGSKTPGHPELGVVPGIEVSTGPLGQGIANAVGMSMASKYAKNLLNSKETEIINHKVYCFCGDGDLQEGISYEACSLAGVHNLDNLILIYDSNEITIEGETKLAWNENIKKRFESQNWEVIEINGHNFLEIENALQKAKYSEKPCIIIAKTSIAKGSVNFEGSCESHGAPLSSEEISISKEKSGLDKEKTFYLSDETKNYFKEYSSLGEQKEKLWNEKKEKLSQEKKELLEKLLNPNFDDIKWPIFEENKSIATRDSNGKILNAIAESLPGLVGGSADLGPSNKTEIKNSKNFPEGKNIHFGIREHAMGAIANGIALYGLFIPYSGTFLVFSDYMKTAVRLASLMKLKQFFIWTHDSIGVGEDGPTHQPIEHLTQFRALPNLNLFRPANANENIECFKIALKSESPSAFVLSRQGLINRVFEEIIGKVENGAYLVKKSSNPKITIIASGSELDLALETRELLETEGINSNIVSLPCFNIFDSQSKEYKNSVLDKKTKIIAIEASRGLELYKYADEVICMETFGESGKASDLFKHFGFTKEKVAEKIKTFI